MSPEYTFFGKEPPTALSIIRLKSNEAGPQYGNPMYPQLSVGRFEGDICWPASHIPPDAPRSPPIVFVFLFVFVFVFVFVFALVFALCFFVCWKT